MVLLLAGVCGLGVAAQPEETPVVPSAIAEVPRVGVGTKRTTIVLGVPKYHAKGLINLRSSTSIEEEFGVKIVVEAAKAVGIDVKILPTVSRTPEELLASGEVDAVTGVSVIDSRLGTMAFTTPIFLARGAFYSCKGTKIVSEAEELLGSRVVVAKNGVAHQWCVERGIPVTVMSALSFALDAVCKGEADYAVTTVPAGRYEIEGLGATDLVETLVKDEHFVRAFAVATRRDDVQLISQLNMGIGILEANGRYGELYAALAERYQPLNRPSVISARVVAWAGLGVGVLVVGLSLGYGISSLRLARRTQEMRSRDEQLAAISGSVPALIYSYFVGRDGSRKTGYMSPQIGAWQRIFPSLNPGQDYKTSSFADIHPDDRQAYERQVEISRREVSRFDVMFRLKDSAGEYRMMHSLVTPRPCDDGVVWHALLVDLSESTRAARVLREANERFEAIFEGSRDAIVVFRPGDEQVLAVNSRACEMYGYTRSEMLSGSLKRVSTNVAKGEELVRRAVQQGWYEVHEWRQRRKDGTIIDVHMSGHAIEYEGGSAVLTINRDVSEQRKLQEAMDRERRVFLGGPTVLFRWLNVPGYPVEYVSANIAQFGYEVEDLVSGRVSAANMVHPEDLERVLMEAAEAERVGAVSYESQYRILTKHGETRWVYDYTALVRDASGKTVSFEGCLTDQTNYRRADEERRQLERQLWNSQRLETLGVLVGGVAHDFNNLLVGILGNAGLARRQFDSPADLTRSLDRIEESGKFAADLIRRLVGYPGSMMGSSEPVDLASLGSAVVDALGARIPRALKVRRSGGAAWISADGVSVKQAVMNLMTNAADAMGNRSGEIRVRTGVRDFSPEHERECVVGRELAPGRYSYLCVEDSGKGISEAVRNQMFEPFVSTGHEGRGLGLALVLSVMRRTGGAVCVRSEPGVGTWFELLWPSLPVPNPKPEPVPEVRSSRSVLVIDDNQSVRGAAVEMIRVLGYTAVEANTGEEGLALIKQRAPDLVLLDISLPGMSGWEVLERIRSSAPEVRVIMSSGHDVVREVQRTKPDAYLSKPYTFDDLRDVLEGLVPIGDVSK